MEGGRIVFLPVPESFRERFDSPHQEHGHEHDDDGLPDADFGEMTEDADAAFPEDTEAGENFSIDPAIPIPVELPPGEGTAGLDRLSREMILSGMLQVIRAHFARSGGEMPPSGEQPPVSGGGGPDADAGFPDIAAADIDYYRRFVLALRPRIFEEFSDAAIMQARNRQFESALEILAAVRGLFPLSPLPLQNQALIRESLAESLEKAGREDEAGVEYRKVREIYAALLAREPPWPEAFFNAGFFYMKLRDFAKARECFSAYIPMARDSEKRDRARAIVREISGNSLDDELFREAYDLIHRGEVEKGLPRIHDFLERHGKVWNGWFLLGWGLRKLGRWADGEAAFRKALELGGGGSDTRNELAICLMEQEHYAEARRELERALRDEPENIKIISNLGVLALRTGNRAEARGFFRTVLELEPGDPIARRCLDAGEAEL